MPTQDKQEEQVISNEVTTDEEVSLDEVRELLVNIDKKLENIEKVNSENKPLEQDFYIKFSDFLTEYKEKELTSFTETSSNFEDVNSNIAFTNHLLYFAIVIALAIYIWGLLYKFIKVFI